MILPLKLKRQEKSLSQYALNSYLVFLGFGFAMQKKRIEGKVFNLDIWIKPKPEQQNDFKGSKGRI